MTKSVCVSLTALFLLVGCGDPAKPGAGSSSAAAPASAAPASSAAPAASSSAAAHEKGKMSHCPNAVAGAKVDIQDADKGVTVTVTSTDAANTTEIRARAKALAERAQGEAAKEQHSGKGGGQGSMGRCPVVTAGTDVKMEEVEGGTKFTVSAKDAGEVDWLRRESKERQAALEAPGGSDAGERKMANCASAVKGAKTTVKEDAGTIVVSVLAADAKDEAAVKDIRERAKKNGELKLEGDRKAHGGAGSGGASGRCPSVLDGTEATVKDIDGGAEITLKPKDAANLKKLTEEAQSRAKPFGV